MKKADNRLRTLDFRGHPIYYLALPEGNLVLIRPLCDILGVDADNQLEKIKADEILAPEHSVQSVQVPGHSQIRNWACLPEMFIYGWLFEVKATNTMKPETKAKLIAYKRGCYQVLFNHFHGKIKEALELDKEEALVNVQLTEVNKRLQKKLQNDPDQRLKEELEAKKRQLGRAKSQNRRESQQLAIEFALGWLAPAEQEQEA